MEEILLTGDQAEAERKIYEWFFNGSSQKFVLSGYAGTGKTFLLSYVVKEKLKLEPGKTAVFITPTGKAASVLQKSGTPAGTVHSLIYMLDEDEFDVDENGEIIKKKDRLTFVKREKIDEKIKLVVVDEASMVSEEIIRDILSFGVKCIFSGDSAQLPPVNGQTELLDNPDASLKEIVRQAKDNPIIKLSEMARKGMRLPFGNFGDKVVILPRSRFFGYERKKTLMRADQIICGRNKTRNELNDEMRRYMKIPEGQALPAENEKLICTLNNWEKTLDKDKKFYLVNGVIGEGKYVVEGLDGLASMTFKPDFLDEPVDVVFDTGVFLQGDYYHFFGDRAVFLQGNMLVHEGNLKMIHKFKAIKDEEICRFEFAYAITCHKAQGSEFDSVVVFDESWAFGEEKERWLYTAITRAKEKLVIVV